MSGFFRNEKIVNYELCIVNWGVPTAILLPSFLYVVVKKNREKRPYLKENKYFCDV